MRKSFLIFIFLVVKLHASSLLPVQYEGRIRPIGSLQKQEQNLKERKILPLNEKGKWGTLEEARQRGTLYPEEILQPMSDSELVEELLKNYSLIEKKVYLEAAGKSLSYPSASQLKAELFLSKLPIKFILIVGYVLGLFLALLKKRAAFFLILSVFLLHGLILIMRSYILMRPPVSNMNETLIYVPWIIILTGLIFRKRPFALSGAALSALALLFFLSSEPNLELVQAVLDSRYWLTVHVLMVVGSYGIFFLAGILGHIYFFNSSFKLEKTLEQLMYIGAAFLICGTVLGGVWAAQSWGRFWDWDPKESWAFISSGLYLAWIHAYKFKKINGSGLAAGAITGLLAITFTWYGVNFILGTGLHSYGFGTGGQYFYYGYLFLELAFLVYALFLKNSLYKNWGIEKKERKK